MHILGAFKPVMLKLAENRTLQGKGRERERERETQRERQRQTDRKADRDRQIISILFNLLNKKRMIFT